MTWWDEYITEWAGWLKKIGASPDQITILINKPETLKFLHETAMILEYDNPKTNCGQ